MIETSKPDCAGHPVYVSWQGLEKSSLNWWPFPSKFRGSSPICLAYRFKKRPTNPVEVLTSSRFLAFKLNGVQTCWPGCNTLPSPCVLISGNGSCYVLGFHIFRYFLFSAHLFPTCRMCWQGRWDEQFFIQIECNSLPSDFYFLFFSYSSKSSILTIFSLIRR